MLQGFGGNGDGNKTAVAGTVINYLMLPSRTGFLHVRSLYYLDSGTQHTLTLLRNLASTTTSGTAAAAQAVVNIVTDPGTALPTPNTISGNDYVAVKEIDGIARAYKVDHVTSLTAVTLTTNLVAGTVAGAPFWFFGISSDTDQRTGSPHPQWKSNSTSSVFSLNESTGFDVGTLSRYEPMLFQSNNATNAGILQQLSWMYTLN